MKELKIYEFQAEHIKDTLRLVANILGSRKKESSVDRDVIQAQQMIDNVLSGEIDKQAKRF